MVYVFQYESIRCYNAFDCSVPLVARDTGITLPKGEMENTLTKLNMSLLSVAKTPDADCSLNMQITA